MGVEKQRTVRQAFLDLLAQRTEMVASAAPRLEFVAEDLRNPLERRLLQEPQEVGAIGHVPERSFQRFVTNLAPTRQVMVQTKRQINAPEVADKGDVHADSEPQKLLGGVAEDRAAGLDGGPTLQSHRDLLAATQYTPIPES